LAASTRITSPESLIPLARFGRAAFAVALGTLVALLVAEGALRAAGYHGLTSGGAIEYDSELGWTIAKNARVWQSGLDFGTWITTDQDGLRVADRAAAVPAGNTPPTLLVLGDSYAFGFGVAADDMVAAALERDLAGSRTPFHVRTAGVPGYATDQELLRWRRVAPAVKPRRVVLLFHQSDLVDNIRPSTVMGPERYYKPRFELHDGALTLTGVPVHGKERLAPAGTAEPLKARLRPLAIYALVQTALLHARPANASAADQAVLPADAPPEADAITGALVGELAREVRDAGGDLTVVLVPTDRAVMTRVANICRAQQVPFIDLGPAFAGARDLRLPFDGHWNARGHAVAAREIAAHLSARSETEPARGR